MNFDFYRFGRAWAIRADISSLDCAIPQSENFSVDLNDGLIVQSRILKARALSFSIYLNDANPRSC